MLNDESARLNGKLDSEIQAHDRPHSVRFSTTGLSIFTDDRPLWPMHSSVFLRPFFVINLCDHFWGYIIEIGISYFYSVGSKIALIANYSVLTVIDYFDMSWHPKVNFLYNKEELDKEAYLTGKKVDKNFIAYLEIEKNNFEKSLNP